MVGNHSSGCQALAEPVARKPLIVLHMCTRRLMVICLHLPSCKISFVMSPQPDDFNYFFQRRKVDRPIYVVCLFFESMLPIDHQLVFHMVGGFARGLS